MYVCTNFIRLEYKFGLSYIFFVGVFAYFQIFQTKDSDEIWKTSKILSKNAYSQEAIDKCISKFLNRTFEHKTEVATVPKEELKIVLIREHAGNYKN